MGHRAAYFGLYPQSSRGVWKAASKMTNVIPAGLLVFMLLCISFPLSMGRTY